MIRLFSFNLLKVWNDYPVSYTFEGFAYGLFLLSPIYRPSDTYGEYEYAEKKLKDLSFFQKLFNKELINNYKAYLHGDCDDHEAGEWCGIHPRSLRLPFRFKMKVKIHIFKDEKYESITYSCEESDRLEFIKIKSLGNHTYKVHS